MLTTDEMQKKYAQTYLDCSKKLKEASGMKPLGYDAANEQKDFARLLDEIALEGYSVTEMTCMADPTMRGVVFIPLTKEQHEKAVALYHEREMREMRNNNALQRDMI